MPVNQDNHSVVIPFNEYEELMNRSRLVINMYGPDLSIQTLIYSAHTELIGTYVAKAEREGKEYKTVKFIDELGREIVFEGHIVKNDFLDNIKREMGI